MRRPGLASVAAGIMTVAALGIGGWKVAGVRRENARLEIQARECRARNDAFLRLVREVGRARAGAAAPGP